MPARSPSESRPAPPRPGSHGVSAWATTRTLERCHSLRDVELNACSWPTIGPIGAAASNQEAVTCAQRFGSLPHESALRCYFTPDGAELPVCPSEEYVSPNLLALLKNVVLVSGYDYCHVAID